MATAPNRRPRRASRIGSRAGWKALHKRGRRGIHGYRYQVTRSKTLFLGETMHN
jgi:hypothetical protein